ncbi:MHS family proline/betaine transporter-like MFS transporter [Paraburkholderia sp. MM5496-R1]
MMNTPPWRKLMAGSVGNFVELYDFAVFGFSVPVLSTHFFPGNNRTTALLSTFAVFAVAFVARPLGGLIFGSMADRIGRVKVMAITVCLMALGTAIIGLLPTYADIGIAAPMMLVGCRLLQGLALGGETTGSQSYIVESAPDDRRGQWVSFTQLFGQLPNAIVAVLLIAVQAVAGSAAYESGLWRIPFLAGGVIGIVGFWIRRNIDEPEEFKQATRTREDRSPLREAIHAGGIKAMLRLLMIMPVYFAGAYILFGFMYTFLVRIAKLDPTTALISNAISVVVLCSVMPFAGMLSDRIGRKRVMSLGAAWLMLTAYPAIHFAASGTFTGALLGQVLIGIGLGINGGASYVAAVEFFPTSFRATGHAISYQVTVAVLGGTSPFMAALLSRLMGTPFAPGLYLAFIAAACLIATQFVPETRGVRLRTSVDPSINESDQIALQKAR